jgi:hypothetical protein
MLEDRLSGPETDRIGTGLCPMTGFGIKGVEVPHFAATLSIYTILLFACIHHFLYRER